MRTLITMISFCLLGQLATAQNSKTYYWITFKDKSGSAYSVDKPEAFLSKRAIDRRTKQHVSITEQDLPVNRSYVDQIKALGGIVAGTSKWFNAISVSNLDANDIQMIGALPFVKKVQKIEMQKRNELDAKFKLEERSFTSSTNLSNKAGGVFNYGLAYLQSNQIGADCMHNNGYTGAGMVIAVLDAGFYKADSLPAFDSLRTNGQILGCRDFVVGDTMVYEDYPHGMNVLSCMGGYLPGSLVGTAPKSDYWLIRTEDAWSESLQEEIFWTIGAEFADSVGADIINSSLGYSVFDNTADNHTYADMDGNTTIITKAADIAASKGIFVTTSAGNAGGPPWYKITAPADADSVLTVGAVDSLGFITGFSSRGLTFDGRIKPDVVARGHNAAFASAWGGVQQGNGTSFSSPITAGAVACLWQANPGKTNMELLYAIQESANQFSAPDSIRGYGVPNFCTANTLLTGIQENHTDDLGLEVFPNPFHNDLTLSFYNKEKQNVRLVMTDISGRAVFQQEFTAISDSKIVFTILPEQKLSAGVYLLNVILRDQTQTIKIIKE
ncbi:MAG: S8 family serine peptidase [Bacteroidia bacterium]|nr:S8 family serine peptidase [Bacteroidia bacterium]